MARVLIVDDSRAIRSIVRKEIEALGLEADEAEDGARAVAQMTERPADLVLLDLTMPVLDGPATLAKLRELGLKTPVIILTSESKRSVLADVMRMKISDYILKPFKPEELRAKITKALKAAEAEPPRAATAATPAAAAASPAAAPAASPVATAAETAAGSEAASTTKEGLMTDVLVVDDLENVFKKLRTLVPEKLTMEFSASGTAALTAARQKGFRVILIDLEIPGTDSKALLRELKTLPLQKETTFLALCMRTAADPEKEVKRLGFDGYLYKPFELDRIAAVLLSQTSINEALAVVEDDVLRMTPFPAWETHMERYLPKLSTLIDKCLNDLAAACFDQVIFDMTHFPPRPDRSPRLVLEVLEKTTKFGLTLKVVGLPETKKFLELYVDTKTVPFFESVEAARA